jgi:hypothetical protein
MSALVERCMLVVSLLACAPAVAQDAKPPPRAAEPEPEVLIPPAARSGGWGGPIVQISTVRDDTAVFAGGRGGWLFDGRLTLGGGGFGLVNRVPAPPEARGPAGEELELEMGYAGGWIEYTFSPLRLVHLSVGTLVGGGGLSLAFHDGGTYGSSDGFFVVEPAVVAEINLATVLRADVGATYRWIAGVDVAGLSSSDVAGFSAVIALKFGKF